MQILKTESAVYVGGQESIQMRKILVCLHNDGKWSDIRYNLKLKQHLSVSSYVSTILE